MKTTEIDYTCTGDGLFELKGFRNIGDWNSIAAEFGYEVLRLYKKNRFYYGRSLSGEPNNSFWCKMPGDESANLFYTGTRFTKKEFTTLIRCMKTAAMDLIKIRKKVSEYKIKTIKI